MIYDVSDARSGIQDTVFVKIDTDG